MMPLSVASRLGITKFEETPMRMIMADRSVRLPVGIVRDFPVSIEGFHIPTDFVVLELDKEAKNPVVFGRPFFATTKATFDVQEGKTKLHLGKGKEVEFGVYKKGEKPIVEGNFFGVEEMSSSDDEWEDAFNDFPYEESNESSGTTRIEASYQLSFKEDPKEKIETLEKKKKLPRRHKNKGLIPLKKELVYHYGEEALALDGSSLESIFSLAMDEKETKTKPPKPTSSKAPKSKKPKEPKGKKPTKESKPPTFKLLPQGFKDGWINYKVKSKGHGKPFVKARAYVGKDHLGMDNKPSQEQLTKVFHFTLKDDGIMALPILHTPN